MALVVFSPPHAVPLFSLSPSAVIGPPGVSLISTEDTIEVSITDPVFARSTLKEAYGASSVTYNITHWKEGHEKQVGCRVKSLIIH